MHKTTQYWPHNMESFHKYKTTYTTKNVFVNNVRKCRFDCRNIATCYPQSGFVERSGLQVRVLRCFLRIYSYYYQFGKIFYKSFKQCNVNLQGFYCNLIEQTLKRNNQLLKSKYAFFCCEAKNLTLRLQVKSVENPWL